MINFLVNVISNFFFTSFCFVDNASFYTTLSFSRFVEFSPLKHAFCVEYLGISNRKCIKNILITQRKPLQFYSLAVFFFFFYIFGCGAVRFFYFFMPHNILL